jgi:hypothetical protein
VVPVVPDKLGDQEGIEPAVRDEPLPVRQVQRPSRQALQQGFFQTKHAEGKQCFNQYCGLRMFIPDSNFLHPGFEFFHPGSASKNSSILTQKNGF